MKTQLIAGVNKNDSNMSGVKSTLHPCRTSLTFLGLEFIYNIMLGEMAIIDIKRKNSIRKQETYKVRAEAYKKY